MEIYVSLSLLAAVIGLHHSEVTFTSQLGYDTLIAIHMTQLPSISLPKFGSGGPITFFNDCVSELKKVVWPTRAEVIKLTSIVLLVSIGMGLYIGGVDLLLTQILTLLLGR